MVNSCLLPESDFQNPPWDVTLLGVSEHGPSVLHTAKDTGIPKTSRELGKVCPPPPPPQAGKAVGGVGSGEVPPRAPWRRKRRKHTLQTTLARRPWKWYKFLGRGGRTSCGPHWTHQGMRAQGGLAGQGLWPCDCAAGYGRQ